jgi:putative tricarboxylic transport membrane protein
MFKKSLWMMVAFIIIVLIATGCSQTAAPAAEGELKYPEKAVEIVCHTNPGDGADVYVRAISDAINANKLMPVTTSVLNKAGGSGANMYNYMMQKAGDPYSMMTAQANLLTSPINNKLPLSYKDFTPVARMAIDPLVVAVRADSPYQTMADLITAAKVKEKAITQAGGLAGATEYFLSYMIEQKTGVTFNLLPHRGGGSEAVVTLLGGNADFVIMNPSELMPQVEAKKLRVIAVATEKDRLASLPDVPTLKEQGIDAAFGLFRGIAMPGNMDPKVVAYVEDVLKKVSESAQWNKYCEDNQLVKAYLPAAEFKAYLDEQAPIYEEVLKTYAARLEEKK